MKIICVGLNYKSHNDEMKRAEASIPSEPVLFLKPDSSLLKKDEPFFIPDFSTNIEHEVEVVVRINKVGKNIATRFAHRYYDQITIGIDMTARDIQAKLKAKGLPWEISKSFDNSAIVGQFVDKNQLSKPIDQLDFELKKNDMEVQKGNTSQMIHSIDTLIAYASQYFTLKIGDLLFTGTPAGVGLINIDDHLEAYLDNHKLLDLYIR